MSKPSFAMDRAVRIELLRARSALERETLARDIAAAGRSLQPRNLLKQWLPGLASGNLSGMVWQGVSLARRYPFIGSAVSTLIMGRGKRLRWLRLAAGALLGWQLVKAYRNRK